MPAGLVPICWRCSHFLGLSPSRGYSCNAYDAIPIDILASVVDHRKPFAGDHGLQFLPKQGNDAVPRLASDPPVSEAQRRAMWAAAEGRGNSGIPESVGKEFAEADPGGKLPARAKDMGKGSFRDLINKLAQFFKEESEEPEHKEAADTWDEKSVLRDCYSEDESEETKEHNEGELTEKTREQIGRAGGEKREDMPDDVFLGPHHTYPVKTKHDGEWKYTRNLLLAAARRARMQHKEGIAKKADAIRAREFAAEEGEDGQVMSMPSTGASAGIPMAVKPKRKAGEDKFSKDEALALDFESARSYDADGRLHVASSHISKATVNDYLGREINAAMQGVDGWKKLDDEKTYGLLRHPDEIDKAAATFNGLPIMDRHVAVSAEIPRMEDAIGCTGNDAIFDGTYLNNSLTFWPKTAIDAIESGEKRELSCAYRYTADMTPGTYKGEPYSGIMRNLVGNHVALVPRGRAGSDVAVGDSDIDRTEEWKRLARALRNVW